MKSIIISSNCSGGGKTTFTLGIIRALKNRGYNVQGYKCGPDYIDPAFHKEVTKVCSRNLDKHLMGEEGLKLNYISGNGEIGIIEGVMGLYDGTGISESSSTYEVSKILGNMPIILVMSPKGQSATICAEINGIRDYKNANIAGVVLNGISEKYYNLLKCAIETNCNIKVFGYVPKDERITLSSRHLGLIQSMEVLNLEEKLEICGSLIEEYIDVDMIINSMKEFIWNEEEKNTAIQKYRLRNQNLRIGVPMDKAFSFYYKNNLELLESMGEIIYFSPMNDKELPKDLDFLYIGGGYPEVFKDELEKNVSIRESIKKALNDGLRCYAECGGLMYLTEKIEDSEMVGFFEGISTMTKRLQRFGYCSVTAKCFEEEINVNAHEFHKSFVDLKEENVYDVEKVQYDGEVIKWQCGYFKKNTLAGYAHINFLGNIELLKKLVNYKE